MDAELAMIFSRVRSSRSMPLELVTTEHALLPAVVISPPPSVGASTEKSSLMCVSDPECLRMGSLGGVDDGIEYDLGGSCTRVILARAVLIFSWRSKLALLRLLMRGVICNAWLSEDGASLSEDMDLA